MRLWCWGKYAIHSIYTGTTRGYAWFGVETGQTLIGVLEFGLLEFGLRFRVFGFGVAG